MYWSTEDHHRHHQPNYYNNYQVAQHQNGVQQATAAVPPPQQHQQTHPTPPPPPQQQQQQQHQHTQQLLPNQQQHLSHRTVQQPMPGHYQANQHYQQHPQHQQQQQQQQQLHHHQQQWVPRPSSILTAPPRMYQQFSATMPSSAQYCTAPPQFYHAPPRVTQPTAVAAPSQQRPSLPPTYGFYPIQQQAAIAAAAALRQNAISQAPTNIMTPPTTTPAQPIQIQYFPTSAYCQPPAFGPVVPSAIPETPPVVVKQRKHAIPIIDPDTKENVLEREFRRSESASPADVRSIGATSSSTSTDLKGLDEEPRYIPQTDDIDSADQDKSEEIEETIDQEEDITDSSAQLPPAVVDHVESIEAKQEVEEGEEEEVVETTTQLINVDDDGPVKVQCINASPTNENEVEYKCTDNNDADKATQSAVEENLPPTMEPTECPTTALKVDKQHQTPTQQQEQLPPPPPPPPMETEEKTIQSPKTASKVVSKQQQSAKPQPAAVKKLPPPKKGKKNKRVKDSQRKQKADFLNTENNNNNTTKITNQNQKPIATEPHNSTKINIQTDSATAADAADDAAKSCAAALLDDHERSDESSEKVDDITENSNTMDDNDQSSQIYDSPKLTKSEQIASEILGIESTDDNSVLFLNSSVSGLEDDLCPSPLDDTQENDKARDICFGDFPEENLTQDKQQDIVEDKKYTYTMETLKSLAGEPASQIAPALKHDHCGKIGKYSGSGPPVASYQQNHMYQQMSYKDSINCLNRRRAKRNDTPLHQQFQQQYDYQQQQQQQQPQQQRKPDIIRINLSLNEEIQLAKSENAWMPAGLQIAAPKSESDEDEKILKKVRGILNKLTPENFDKLLQSASSFPINGPERMKKVMLLIFEKTISEPNFAPTYACFCKFLFNAKNQNHEAFNKILIKRINDEFESNVNNAKAKNAKLRPIMDKLAAATDPKEVAEIKAELDDQEYKFRRRAWGTVRFIGEMFKLGFISTEKVCACVEELFDPKCEEKLEYMCKLLTTVGAQLEPVNKHQTSADKSISNRLSELFTKIRQLVERKKLSGIKISSRVRFMLQDMCDLRRRSWDQKISATPPPAMRSRESSPAITKVAHQSHQRDRGPPPRMSNNYIQSGGGYDKRRQQTAGDEQKKSAQNKIDINKLMPMFNNGGTTRPLGNSSLPKWHQRGPSSGIQQNRRPPLSSSECKRLLSDLVELVIDDEPKTKWFAEWKQIPSDQHPTLIYYLFAEYLLSAKLQRVEINACTRIFISLIREDLLTHAAFNEGYQKFSADSYDILLDVPKGWQYIFDFLGPLLHLELIPFSMIWCPKWYDSLDGEKFLHSMIRHFTSEFGANYMRYIWEAYLQWETFMTEDRAQSFIANNNFEFIENEKCRPPKLVQRTVDEQVQRIKELLSESDRNVVDMVIDFLSTNVHIDCSFIRKLTSYICDYIVIYNNTPNSSSLSSNSNKKSKLSNSSKNAAATLRKGELKTMCIPIFRRCIDSKDEHELSCLDAIVKRCKDLYGSSADNLIREILTELDGVVISKESFEKWYQQQLSHDDNILTNDLNEFFQSRHDCD